MNIAPQQPAPTDCDREPIHLIPAVQSFGGLLAVNGDWIVAQRSLNCADIAGLGALPEVGAQLAELFTPRAITILREAVDRIDAENAVERLFGIRLVQGGPLLDCAMHQSGNKLVIEFEPHAEADFSNHLSLVGPVLRRLEPIREERKLLETAVELLRDMLGYDRVMVYRFLPDESGEVVAEARRDDLEPFLGLRYPRADIPQQARELFVRNKFRVLGDMSEQAVPIEPVLGIDQAPLDMSMSVLRAQSQVHLQYLKNMGVEASLSISIVRNGKLWGLFALHHYSPRLPAYSLRTVAETFSQMFSLMLDRLLIDRSEKLRARGKELHDQLMLRLAGGTSLANDLPMLEEVLGDLIAHDGVSVLMEGEYRSRGAAPSAEQFAAVSPLLAAAPSSSVLAVSALADQIPEAAAFADVVTGALVLPISRSPRDFLVLWRRPLTQVVQWAGDPSKAVAREGERLDPRGSFAAWAETVEGRSDDWSSDELTIAENLRITLLEVVLRMSDEASRERKRAQEHQELLIAELNHRVRNILNLISGLVGQSQDEAMSVTDFASIIGGRIAALASAHDNITRESWSPAPLSSLFETELAAYLTERTDRFQLKGEQVLVKPEAYTVLALVVHELVTNSAKHGALGNKGGSLVVTVGRSRNGDLTIAWRERGGPPVQPPSRRGFGSTIIERSIPYELKGEAEQRFKLTGLEADFLVPARFVDRVETAKEATGDGDATGKADAPATGARERDMPGHVLVVEDSMIIALDTEDMLRHLGVASVAVESSVEQALRSIEKRVPDFALIDFNLGDETSVPVAEELERRGVRFVLATGYSEIGQEASELGAAGLIHKPYGRKDLAALLVEDS
ncbi:HWE histidine kinase domain-containing protein [Qipengyuania nanhaisediminis]|uniref:HWE histidine kinase domain-containing protein n=1 Tax=Qipengyuania nanhaisediminis TaxID=604088 RepID=UPI0038B407A4